MKGPEGEVTVKLLQRHRHAGKDHPKGASISVPQRLLGWLEENGVIALRQNTQEGKRA